MTDEQKALVERLRKARVWPDYSQSRVTIETAHEAADTIEAQAREIERLREALEWSIAEIEGRTRYTPNNIYAAEEQQQNALDAARAALEETSHEHF